MPARPYRAGQTLEDHCRACHADRFHTIVVVDEAGDPLRVTCDYCGSEHRYRGGGRTMVPGDDRPGGAGRNPADEPRGPRSGAAAGPLRAAPPSLVSDREIAEPHVMADPAGEPIEALLRRVIREETGLTAVTPAEKWRGGDLVLRPGKPGVQEKSWPIETFFHKIVMLRNRLRTLEQHVNASDLPDDQKLKLQAYVTGCYGSLTSFNVLFADDADRFVGSGD
jgi:hypothetical protein